MAATNSPAAKTERLLNLVMTLLYTSRPMSKARIRETVEQYRLATSDESFDRMFERDKEELRELGIPLVTEEVTVLWDGEPGYRIDQRDYALPDLRFDPDELAVLGLAARAWSHATLAGPAANALAKLRAGGLEPDDEAVAGLEPRLTTSEPAFAPLLDASLAGQPVTFRYDRTGRATGSERHVQPWGLTARNGHWYLTGFDTDRHAPRVFRLSRISGRVAKHGRKGSYTVPADHDPVAMLRRRSPLPPRGIAEVLVRDGAGHALRRRATTTAPATPGWSTLAIPYADPADLAHELASYAGAVRVEAPADVRDHVRELLTEVAHVHTQQHLHSDHHVAEGTP